MSQPDLIQIKVARTPEGTVRAVFGRRRIYKFTRRAAITEAATSALAMMADRIHPPPLPALERCRCFGHDVELPADHDGKILAAQVVRGLARRVEIHGFDAVPEAVRMFEIVDLDAEKKG